MNFLLFYGLQYLGGAVLISNITVCKLFRTHVSTNYTRANISVCHLNLPLSGTRNK